jgi:glycosyltransferase involved in cell wall biosynthesis
MDARLAFQRGVGTYTAQLAIALARRNRDIELTLINAPAALKNFLQGASARFIDVPLLNAALYEQIRLPALAQKEKLSLLHYTDNSGSIGWMTPYVVTLHDAMMTRPIAETFDGTTLRQCLVGFYKRWCAAPSGRKAKLVLTVSEAAKRDLVERMWLPTEKIRVVYEGVDAEFFARPRSFRKSSRKCPLVLVQGALDKRKNIPGVFETVARLKAKRVECSFRVIGCSREDFARAGYVRLAESLGVADRVEWAGQVASERLPQEYWEADLFLYPSLWEGFGLPVLEAFAAGTPVVASNTTSIPEVAGNAAKLADPTDPEALARAVQQVLRSPRLQAVLTARGFQRVRRFTWEKAASGTAEVYREAAERAHP